MSLHFFLRPMVGAALGICTCPAMAFDQNPVELAHTHKHITTALHHEH